MSIEPKKDLVSDLKNLILETKNPIAVQVNAAMTMMYWQIGNKINTEVLQDQRAEYGKKIIKNVAIELTQEFGNSFSEKNLRRMMKFALVFNDVQIVAPLVRQLSWSHFDNLKIKVAEYLLVLPEKKVLLEKLHRSIEIAKNKITNNAESIDDQTVICNLVQPFSAAFFCEFRRNERCYSVGIYSDEATKWRNRKASGKAR